MIRFFLLHGKILTKPKFWRIAKNKFGVKLIGFFTILFLLRKLKILRLFYFLRKFETFINYKTFYLVSTEGERHEDWIPIKIFDSLEEAEEFVIQQFIDENCKYDKDFEKTDYDENAIVYSENYEDYDEPILQSFYIEKFD